MMVQAIDGGLIPWPEQVEHPPKLGSVPFGSGRAAFACRAITMPTQRPNGGRGWLGPKLSSNNDSLSVVIV